MALPLVLLPLTLLLLLLLQSLRYHLPTPDVHAPQRYQGYVDPHQPPAAAAPAVAAVLQLPTPVVLLLPPPLLLLLLVALVPLELAASSRSSPAACMPKTQAAQNQKQHMQ
jgi:hypothetical protein